MTDLEIEEFIKTCPDIFIPAGLTRDMYKSMLLEPLQYLPVVTCEPGKEKEVFKYCSHYRWRYKKCYNKF